MAADDPLAFQHLTGEDRQMLTGKRFRLTTATLGIERIDGHRTAVQVPPEEIVVVLSGPRPDDRRMVEVSWDGRTLVMFAEDVQTRGQEIGLGSSVGA
jgi:hypothetical protein